MSKPEGSSDEILVLGLQDSEDRWVFSRGSERLERAAVKVEDLKARLTEFLSGMEQVVAGMPAALGGFNVESLTVSLEITAKGTVSLLGTGGEIGGSGGITIELKRMASAP